MIIDLSSHRRRVVAGLALAVATTGVLLGVLRPDDPRAETRTNTNTRTDTRTGTTSPQVVAPSSPTPRTQTRSPRGLVGRPVNRRSVEAVAIAFCSRMELVDTAVDNQPEDAYRRAAAFADPKVRRALLAKVNEPAKSDDYVWNNLREENGWTTVTTRLGGIGPPPPDTATTADRAVSVTVVEHGGDNWQAPVRGKALYVLGLELTGTGWAVSSYQEVGLHD